MDLLDRFTTEAQYAVVTVPLPEALEELSIEETENVLERLKRRFDVQTAMLPDEIRHTVKKAVYGRMMALYVWAEFRSKRLRSRK